MHPIDLLKLVFTNLSRSRVRASLSASGVVIGAAAVVILVSLANGVQTFATRDLSSIGPLNEVNIISLAGGAGGGGGAVFFSIGGPTPGDLPRLTPKYLATLARRDDVKAVMARARLNNASLRHKQFQSTNASVFGVDEFALEEFDIPMDSGDSKLGRWQVVVGAKLGESFVDQRSSRSEKVDPIALQDGTLTLKLTKTDSDGVSTTRTVRLRVVGVMAPRGGDSDYAIYMRLADYSELSAWQNGGTRPNWRKDGYSEAIVLAKDSKYVSDITGAARDDGFIAFSSQHILDQINRTFGVLQAFVGGIGLITLTIAGTGIANTLITAIYERTNEIGLMKAVGATDGQVMAVFLAEAGAIGGLGGSGGLLVGLVVSLALNVVANQYLSQQLAGQGGSPQGDVITTPLWLIVGVPLFAALMGMLAGLYPARRAAALDPVAALRAE